MAIPTLCRTPPTRTVDPIATQRPEIRMKAWQHDSYATAHTKSI